MATTVSGIHPTASGYPSGLTLYSQGPLFSSNNVDLFEYGHIFSSDNADLFECGHIVASGGYQDDSQDIRGFFMLITGAGEESEETDTSNLVTDTWADNLKLRLQPRKIIKTLTVTPTTSGTPVSQTAYFFNKNCPYNGRVLRIKAIAKSLTTADFNGTGGAVNITVQRSDEVDSSPNPPTTPSWDTLLESTSCKDKSTDELCLDAPYDGINTIDQTYHTVSAGGSLRATLTAQVENTYSGDGSTVEILLIIEYLPTDVKARYWR